MKNLVIGNTSQLSHYFPEEYEKISSRNIDLSLYKDEIYDRVFLCFAEQRTYIMDDEKLFNDLNVYETLRLVEFFSSRANYVVTYGTCELWNNIEGPVSIDTPFNYKYSPYCVSKELMTKKIHELNNPNVIVIHTFNFNSPFRKPGFLFAKIFDSLINQTKIEIGDTYYYRDMIHPKYVVERSLSAKTDELVGSGRLTFVNDFIRDLFYSMKMDYNEYVTEKVDSSAKRTIYYLYSKEPQYSYDSLLKDSLYDIELIYNS
jgi:hypothetical protein